jgi:hypothetical protein
MLVVNHPSYVQNDHCAMQFCGPSTWWFCLHYISLHNILFPAFSALCVQCTSIRICQSFSLHEHSVLLWIQTIVEIPVFQNLVLSSRIYLESVNQIMFMSGWVLYHQHKSLAHRNLVGGGDYFLCVGDLFGMQN